MVNLPFTTRDDFPVWTSSSEGASVTKRDALVAALVVLGLAAVAAYLTGEQEVASGFAQVIDGDSIRVDGRDIRIAGIDAPELRQTCVAEAGPYPCGEVARRALGDLLAGRPITCRISGRDRYGRRLGSCEAAGEDLGAALVSRGYAVAYGRYEREEALARRQRLKLWSGSFERPSEWRKAHSDRAPS
jgi:endonuclease YncB( thermonuclease family)